MSDLVIRRNLFSNPLFDPDGTSRDPWGTDLSRFMTGDGTLDVSEYDGAMSMGIVGMLTGEAYVFRCRAEGDAPRASIWSDVQISSDVGPENGVITIKFRYRNNGNSSMDRIAFSGGVFSEPQLELAGTFNESLPFFYHGTMPYPRSAS